MSGKNKRVIIEDVDVFINSDLILEDLINKVPYNTMVMKIRTARHMKDYKYIISN